MAVHPRVCGELALEFGEQDAGRRFIPACAGNSTGMEMKFHNVTVHPRVCGELCVAELRAAGYAGSSPRVRGTHFS